MAASGEKILIVESDPDISDLIARQALQPLGYQVVVATEASAAIQQAVSFNPDLIISNLNLPGLSGKDLLVALSSQGLRAPLIVLAAQGQERDVIQAFRLGASDYLLWPARDAEVVAAVERALKQTRETRTRQRLDRQLQDANQEVQRKVRELTTILAVGRAIISITDQRALLGRIVDSAVEITEADLGWLMLRDERSKAYLLVAHKDLPEGWAKKLNQPVDDGVSALVALSGETLSIHGEPLGRFKIAALGKSAAVAPIKVRQEVIGLLTVVRKESRAFGNIEQALLEALADFASISLVNAQLFRALELTAEAARNGEARQNALLQAMRAASQEELQSALYPLDLLLTGTPGELNAEQRQAVEAARAALQRLLQAVGKTVPPLSAERKK
jgi:DNA-binding response OmpR family regulator